jgi:carbon-monoxide dehydrogenase iron sulfur subunit
LVCVVSAPTRDKERGKVIKCDLYQGKEVPYCVANCPNQAKVYGKVVANDDRS